jgi:transposase
VESQRRSSSSQQRCAPLLTLVRYDEYADIHFSGCLSIAKFTRLKHLWADAGYCRAALREWITERLGLSLEIVQRRRRWVAERTFAWITRNRRMSRDYEFLTETGEALIYVTMIRLMLKRLAEGAQ